MSARCTMRAAFDKIAQAHPDLEVGTIAGKAVVVL